MDDQLSMEIKKLITDGNKAGDEAAKPHLISAGELLIEARQHFPDNDRKFWQWAIRNFSKTPGEWRKAECRAHLQRCIDLATKSMWERLSQKDAERGT